MKKRKDSIQVRFSTEYNETLKDLAIKNGSMASVISFIVDEYVEEKILPQLKKKVVMTEDQKVMIQICDSLVLRMSEWETAPELMTENQRVMRDIYQNLILRMKSN